MKTIDAEVVMPNSTDNPWPHPVGYPVVLGDGKAYYIACAAGAGRAADLLEKLDQMMELQMRFQTGEPDANGETVKPSQMVRKLSEFSAFNLALQYNDATIENLINVGALTAKEMGEIVTVAGGQSPGYEVRNKKK